MSTDHHLEDDADDQRRGGTFAQTADGRWVRATPIGWLEEHNGFAAWLLALRGLDHCGHTVTRTERVLAGCIGLGWAALTFALLALLVDALS